ncbi:MAG: hypothetical protein O3C57_08605 [Verrucomicrobia bacterium]|nr:hypothetical protein [Verrucomicrobiota bacterium]
MSTMFQDCGRAHVYPFGKVVGHGYLMGGHLPPYELFISIELKSTEKINKAISRMGQWRSEGMG